MRKKGYKGSIIDKGGVLQLVLIAVYGERNLLEGKEADTQGQEYVSQCIVAMKKIVDVADEKIVVFKIEQNAEVDA